MNDSPRPADLAQAGEALEQPLYEVRKEIYSRAVSGWFARWRWALVIFTQLVYYGGPWLIWNGRQAVLFDLVARKFYIFGIVFWPQDFIYLTGLLVISALSLFLFTAVAGRLWCGYACPQTVYTEIFMWIERKIEGDRSARMRLDMQAMSARKFGLKSAKHGLWIALSLWTGFTFVGYFTPIHQLGAEVAAVFAPAAAGAAPALGAWEIFWVLFYGFATYGNAGWMREQVCKYMCPYARFQSAMFDPDTLIITYDPERGEPRGPRARNADAKSLGLGHCVDCGVCVQVCPTGIDIRDGLQYECIGCAACIDGCNKVMARMGLPKGLIRYTTENALRQKLSPRQILARSLRPRVLVYTAILWTVIVAIGVTLYMRVPLKVDVIRDRASLSREVDGRWVENIYQLQIMNTQEAPHRFVIRASGAQTLQLVGADAVDIDGAATRMVPVRLRVDKGRLPAGSHKIEFEVAAADDAAIVARERSIFLVR
ncbi:MAG: cytochrome c oxidase accessory protein CcoG [Burkholderiales bacterium]|nr:cytochrome c oxidase accessory protein CcoG [Burkholderiales bacterium]